MANDELCIRFSDYTYATKQEVSKALGISMVDDIWNRIIQYRSTFHRRLSLRNIEKSPYHVTLTPTIGNKLTSIERKFNKFILKYLKSEESLEVKKLTEDHYIRCLYWVAKKYNLRIDEPLLESIVRHDISTIAPDTMLLVKYFEALEYGDYEIIERVPWRDISDLIRQDDIKKEKQLNDTSKDEKPD